MVKTFILSNLDYCNAILICQPNYQIQIMQKLLNKAVRFILDVKFDDHITPYLCKLHILPVKFRVRFKICLIAFKIVRGKAPEYLTENFEMFVPLREINLRPGTGRDDQMMAINLEQQKKKTLYTKIKLEWNDLPFTIRTITNLNSFKASLKTHFFTMAFQGFL